MGGKTNPTQRTKNGVRPSSSGRSAEFLQGATSYTFSGFLPSGGDASSLKTTVETPINEEFASIDPNIQVVLKKLTKKDSVTKGKALLELTQLIEESGTDVVKAVLPLWPRLYKSLYADISHRVREYCQQAHKAFVVKLSKQLAPILKQICPEWIGSQFDTYAPAASVARNSLAAAFPAHKLKDVLAFCHDELLEYVHRMLLIPMPMPADKSYTPEEYEARSERLVYMGLHTYNFYLRHIETGLWKDKLDRHQAILADGKFWSYAKHKSPQVKSAWLELIGTILDKTSGILDDFHAKIVSAVVQNLDDGDALVQSAAWTCLLRIQLIIPNWIQHTSVEKAFLVKIRKVLSEPNQGLTTHLLPFVSHMNEKVLGTHCQRFFMDFFTSLRAAMMKCKSGSAQEFKVLVDTYFECLHYVIKKIQVDKEFMVVEDMPSFKRSFVDQFLVNPIQWTVWESGKALDHVARNAGLVLGYWSVNEVVYKDLWTGFWEEVNKSVFKVDVEDIGAMGYQIQLVISLRKTDVSAIMSSSPRKKKSVRFGGEEEDNVDQEEVESDTNKKITLRSNNWEELFNVADQLVQRSIQQMIITRNPIFIKFLYKLLTQFEDARLVNSIDKVLPLSEFVDKVFSWISDESIVSEEMIDLLMNYGIKSIPLPEIVDRLMSVDNYAVKNWTVLRVGKDPKIVLSECRSIAVYMEHILMRLINGMSVQENCKMVRTYFDGTLTKGQTPTDGHNSMIEMICTEIDEGENVNQQLNSLARYLLKTIKASQETTTAITQRLFITVFKLHLNDVDGEAYRVCQDVVESAKVALDSNLVTLCMDLVKGRLSALFEADNFNIDTVVESCELLMKGEGDEEKDKDIWTFDTRKEDAYVKHVALTQTCVDDAIQNMYKDSEEEIEEVTRDNHLRSVMIAMKVAALRGQLCLKGDEMEKKVMGGGIRKDIESTRDCVKILVETGLEDQVLTQALSDLSLVIDKLPKPTPTSPQTPNLDQLFGTKALPKDDSISSEILEDLTEIRVLLKRHFSRDFNTLQDKAIIRRACDMLGQIIPLSKLKQIDLLYNTRPEDMNDQNLLLAAGLAGMLKTMLENCPSEITPEQWDFLRIALSSWILTVSLSQDQIEKRLTLTRFVVAVMELFSSLMTFFESERQKSSTQLFCKVIEEWNSVFAREVNTVLLLVLNKFLTTSGRPEMDKYLLNKILPCFESMNFIFLMVSKDVSKNVSQAQFLHTLFTQLAHPVPSIRYAVLRIVHKVIPQLVSRDNDQLTKYNDIAGKQQEAHYLETCIAPLMDNEEFNLANYVQDFQYRFTDAEEFPDIPEDKSTAYFYLWNAVLNFCRKATPELRAFYAKWIASRGWEGVLLKAIFRQLPQDVVRNFETKSSMLDTYFASVKGLEICDKNLNTEQLVCYTYLNLVRLLPAVVRKCWTNLPHRTNLLIEKFNMFYASSLLCQEELRSLVDKREKMDNIQISVHNSTREIIAVYAKEEARMELMIMLPLNYPLAVAKVEGGKSVNSRIQSKEVLMQLNLFLSHQNGTIFNGLSLWKRNLDKKFEGVEECYVCYSVIHQDTYQLPKLTCKTCKKKFHSPCLYRWFSTSNKSTCPICRNIF